MGSIFTTDESQPKPTGHYLARLNLHLTGTIFDLWMLWKSLMVVSLFINVWQPAIPEILFLFYIPTLLLDVGFLIFDSLFMGSLKRKKKEVLTPERIWDRIVRSAGNQWLTSANLVGSGFTLIWMLIFYGDQGVAPWLPLTTATPTGLQVTNLFIRKGFELATLAICYSSFIITLYTGSDSLKRHINAVIRSVGDGGEEISTLNAKDFHLTVSNYAGKLLGE
jgi:hypothetical protein